MTIEEYVLLDNLSETQNNLMNILWYQNREMTLDELTKSVNETFAQNWSKGEIRQFMQALVKKEYAQKRHHNLKSYYNAAGCGETF